MLINKSDNKKTCEKCLHYEICQHWDPFDFEGRWANKCSYFKDDSKQIPQKPLPEERYYGVGKCPSCKVVFLDNTTKYCGNCGQALDWGEKTET